MPLNEILNSYYSKEQKQIFVLGIDGLGGSGKTTYAKSIENSIKNEGIHVDILHIDDFIHPRQIRYNLSKADWECYYYIQWRYDYLIKEILAPIQLGCAIKKQIEVYDKRTDHYFLKNMRMYTDSILVIEGVFLQRAELNRYFDYMIYMDVPKEERFQRVLKRDTYIGDDLAIKEKYKNRYFPAEEKYIEEYAPAFQANRTITTKN
ncbi:AAA family ATPase [Bacillus sp. Bva_UNVM-123]|uniref:AAA family ATPase n=1 Tax=Bacillus sp. Bva_UNVM-123 TaxID=2829798 RepID=UPI00391FB55A